MIIAIMLARHETLHLFGMDRDFWANGMNTKAFLQSTSGSLRAHAQTLSVHTQSIPGFLIIALCTLCICLILALLH